MNAPHRYLGALLLALGCCSLAQAQDTPPANARLQQQEMAHGDPARWYQGDSTPAEQLRTLRKEINAAYQEATIACKHKTSAERPTCMKDAHETYARDMANAPQQRVANNRLSSVPSTQQ